MITLNSPPSYLLHCIVNILVGYPLSYLAKNHPKYRQLCSTGAPHFCSNTRGFLFMASTARMNGTAHMNGTVRMSGTVSSSGAVHIDTSHPLRNVCAT